MKNLIVTYILTYEDETSFIHNIKGIINNNEDTPHFFLIYKSSLLLTILQNYRDGSKFRLLIHQGSERLKNTKVPLGNLIKPLKNSDFFKGAKFDFITRDIEPFENPSDTFTLDKEGNVIHNANEMDHSITERMILYEVKNSKASGKVTIDNLAKQMLAPEKIVILTALDLELKEVKKYLSADKEIIEDRQKQVFYEKYLHQTAKGKTFEIHLKVTNTGNVASSQVTGDAIINIDPDYLFYLGIAGKLKDVDIGDVVAADTVENYEGGKNDNSGTNIRIYQGHADDYLLSLASSIITDGKNIWQKNILFAKDERITHQPRDIKGRIATGEKVLGSITSDLYKEIRKSCSSSVAVECEGGGFYHSCNKKHKKCLLIRGISDKLKNKALAEEFDSQPYASSCAAAFLFELIELL